MNISQASMSSTTRFVLTMGAIYGALSLGCVLDDNNEPGEDNNPTTNNPTTNNPTTNNPTGGDCNQVLDASFEFGSDTTVCGNVTVTSNVRLQDSESLTILPGTTVTMCVDCYIEVGAFGNAATLRAVGTAEKPIVFKGSTEEAGFWDGIYFKGNATSNSTLEYVTIKDAGSDEAALYVDRAIALKHITIKDSASSGLEAIELDEDSIDLNVESVEKWAAVLTGAEAVTNLPVDGDLTRNIGEGSIRVDAANADGKVLRFKDAGIPYFIGTNIRLVADETMVVEAGVTLEMGVDMYIEIGAFGNAATLNVEGTSANPVVIEGATAEAGFWDGLYVKPTATGASSIDYLTVRHGGGSDSACVNIERDITIKNLSIEVCETAGFEVGDAGFGSGSEAISVSGVEGSSGIASWNGALTIPKGGDFTGNESDEIAISGGSADTNGTLPSLGVPYVSNSHWRLTNDASITVEPGVEIAFGPDKYIEVGAFGNASTFVAVGSALEPIIFTGTDPSAGSWGGVYLNANVTSSTKLDYVQISYGGTASESNLEIRGVGEVTNCVLSNSAGYGIIIETSSTITADLSASNTFSGNAEGDINDKRD